MKMCNSEAMKAIKELEEKKAKVIYTENNRSRIAYKEGEIEDKNDYSRKI